MALVCRTGDCSTISCLKKRAIEIFFRSSETLQEWLREFAASESGGGTPYVADQDASDGRDSGLVVYPLQHATTSVFIQPVATGSLWA